MVKSLPGSQMLRIKRIVDREERVNKALVEMVTKFKERGYPRELVNQHKTRVDNLTRKQASIPRNRGMGEKKRIPFITTYTNWSNRVSGIINKHWSIIQQSHRNIREFQDRPLLSYRRPVNLRDKLVKSDVGPRHKKQQTFVSKPPRGSFPCLQCVSCQYMHKGGRFIHPGTGESYRINFFLTCESNHVIYALWCPCNLLYIEETRNEVKIRLNQHRYSIRKKPNDLPVPKHFNELNHTEKDLKFMVIDHIPIQRRGGDRILALKRRELMWIHRCNSLTPGGLNVDFKILPGM